MRGKEKNQEIKAKPRPAPEPAIEINGRVMQRNEAKWNWKFTETDSAVMLDVSISKFLETGFIDVDVHPTWIRVTIKMKVLQLMLPCEVNCTGVISERSTLTGNLLVTMLKDNCTGFYI